MIWTKAHAEYLEREIQILIRAQNATEDQAARDVLRLARQALINLRRPVTQEERLKRCPICQEGACEIKSQECGK